MNVLEKILEEIEERIKRLNEADNMCRVNAERNRNFESMKYFQSLMFATERAESIIGDIIRSHMDEAKDINVPSNDEIEPVSEEFLKDCAETSAKYRKKPVEIEAFQYTGHLRDSSGRICVPELAIEAFENGTLMYMSFSPLHPPCDLYVRTLEGDMHAKVGDYIIKGVNGELYPCKPDIFEKTYEQLDQALEEENDNE